MRITKDKKIMILSLPRTRTLWLVESLKNELFDSHDMQNFFLLNEKTPSNADRGDWPPHSPNCLASKQVKLPRSEYKKFATIRNPWERYASFYLMVKKAAANDRSKYAQKTGDTSVLTPHRMTQLAVSCDFPTFIHHMVAGDRTFDLMPAFNFFLNNHGNFDIDHIFDYHDTSGIKNFFKSRGYEFLDIKVGAPKRDWKSLYTKTAIKMVEKFCELEIRYFGYSF